MCQRLRAVVRWAAVVWLVTAAAWAQEPSSVLSTEDAPLMGVADFDFAAIHQWWAVELDLGKGIADLIADALVNDGAYRILERRFLGAVIAEQSLVGAGKLQQAKYLVVGSVTKFGVENESRGVGGFFRGVALLGKQKSKAHVGIIARVVAVGTGEVVASVTSEGLSSRSGHILGGAGPGFFVGAGMTSSQFRETILSEATGKAVRQLVDRLVAHKARLTSRVQ